MIAVDEDTIRRDVRQWSGLVLTGAWVAGWLGGWVAGWLGGWGADSGLGCAVDRAQTHGSCHVSAQRSLTRLEQNVVSHCTPLSATVAPTHRFLRDLAGTSW